MTSPSEDTEPKFKELADAILAYTGPCTPQWNPPYGDCPDYDGNRCPAHDSAEKRIADIGNQLRAGNADA